ncbi:MAG: TIR domain-containing protein, partial [Butyrivibrio sp.]|nr:TIR domain-containing protein [Butyrivibrio sp.]
MSIHYNAFISYKHADLDNKIAAYVEKHLERYHIPAKIRKKTGIKKIERIFRDTDELPITSDLTGTIEEALKNADYLIVICSTNTCKSMWVEREIKLFLQNHPKENILTVLADGEPVDVVPEILKNREVTRVDENGKSVTVIEPVEPLSCDFRLPLRTAKNVELPRLAAALIGCQYNELMDRQRQYKMKRLTAIFAGIMALSLGFGAYMFRSNQIIRESRQEVIENYRASLISQSRYLANESEKLLDNEQRIDALHLALAALPSEEIPDRPVVPEAERALSQATLAYSQRSSFSMTSVWNYDLPNRVENMDVSADNNLFSAMDYKGNIKVWDTESHTELYSYKPKDAAHKAENIKLLDDGSLIITGSQFITSIDPRTGTENWNNDKLESYLDARYSAIVTRDGNLLVALDGQAQLHPVDNQFAVFSSKDGSLVKAYTIPVDVAPNGVNSMILSADNTKIAFTYTNDNRKTGLGIFDIPSEKYTLHPGEFEYLPAMCFSKENNLFISYMEDPLTSPTSTSFWGM